MKQTNSTTLAALLVLTTAACAWASPGTIEDLLRDDGVVFDQQPTLSGGPLADTLALDELGYEMWEQGADNIRLSQAATIRRVNWRGFYGVSGQSHQPPPGDETMRIRFYAARPGDGLPGGLLLEQSFLNPPRVPTGSEVLAEVRAPEYLYQADLSTPIALSANTIYWLEVVQVGDVNSTFRWESGYGLVSCRAFVSDSIPNWTSVSGSYAFQLSTLPEPATIALLACAALIVRLPVRGRKGNRQRWLTGHPNEEHQP